MSRILTAFHNARLDEAGRALSAANEARVRSAIAELQQVLAQLARDYDAEERAEATEEQAQESLRESRGLLELLEAELSHDQVRRSLHQALQDAHPRRSEYVYPVDVFDKSVVYRHGTDEGPSKLMRRSYAMGDGSNGNVTLGDPEQVQAVTNYEPVSESATDTRTEAAATFDGDFVPLVEKAVRADGTVPLKLIQPGWGSSGFYGAQMLERDGPKVFTKGTKMFWNHPTAAEEAARPERDLRDLAAELTSNARWDPSGSKGPGLYADAKVFGGFKESVEDLAPHIGVSIRALGRAKPGEAEGRKGPIVESIVGAKSVDFVTTPGAGGEILSLFEAARTRTPQPQPTPTTQQENPHVEQELQEARRELEQARAELARLREAAVLREARDVATAQLAKTDLPEITRARLVESLARNPVLKDGAIDAAAFATAIDEAAKAEVEYLAKLTGSGQIRGMGGSSQSASTGSNLEESHKSLESAFARILGTESTAKIAAKGRA